MPVFLLCCETEWIGSVQTAKRLFGHVGIEAVTVNAVVLQELVNSSPGLLQIRLLHPDLLIPFTPFLLLLRFPPCHLVCAALQCFVLRPPR